MENGLLLELLHEYLQVQAQVNKLLEIRNENTPRGTGDSEGYERFRNWVTKYEPLHRRLYIELPHLIVQASLKVHKLID